MRQLEITESKSSSVELTDDQAVALRQIGRDLASSTRWWGDSDDEDATLDRSVVELFREGGSQWRVRVRDAIGLIGLPGLQIEVQPKIPTSHVIYLLTEAEGVPRVAESAADAETGTAFWKLLTRWYLTELESILRRDLVKGYETIHDQLSIIRGRLDAVRTARPPHPSRRALGSTACPVPSPST